MSSRLTTARRSGLVFVLALVTTGSLYAQTPAAEPPASPVSGTVSAGLALTSGNKDTSTFNVAFDAKYDPKTNNVFKAAGLILYGKTDGASTAEQYSLTFRDEYSFSPKAFAFGELRYLHDYFKGISYLIAPTVGVGYKLLDDKTTQLSVSAGVGGVWEKDYGFDPGSSGAITADQRLTHKLSATATVGESFTALWKTSDLGDAVYTFGANITAAITPQAQLKAELLDTVKTSPPNPAIKNNDVALLMAVVYKF